MMHERTTSILEAAIREFIKTGEPVSSQHLYDHYRFGVKPAMIRLELNDLTDHGYLEQPHHSAGRVPTNRGYEFFAAHVLHEPAEEVRMGREFAGLWNAMELPHLLDVFSRELGMLGVAVDAEEGTVYKEGLENLIDRLEWSSRVELRSVIRDFEEIEERAAGARAFMEDDDLVKVFIGKKSPVTTSQCLSVVAGNYNVDGERFFLFAVGPKRMDYERTVGVFRGLQKRVKE